LTLPQKGVQCGYIKNHIGSGGIPITTEIGIRELKIRASEVVRAVMENRSRYVVTLRGKPAALLIPLGGDYDRGNVDEVWNRLEKLRQEISKEELEKKNTMDILLEMRR
jgi:prevent-host-death family protein